MNVQSPRATNQRNLGIGSSSNNEKVDVGAKISVVNTRVKANDSLAVPFPTSSLVDIVHKPHNSETVVECRGGLTDKKPDSQNAYSERQAMTNDEYHAQSSQRSPAAIPAHQSIAGTHTAENSVSKHPGLNHLAPYSAVPAPTPPATPTRPATGLFRPHARGKQFTPDGLRILHAQNGTPTKVCSPRGGFQFKPDERADRCITRASRALYLKQVQEERPMIELSTPQSSQHVFEPPSSQTIDSVSNEMKASALCTGIASSITAEARIEKPASNFDQICPLVNSASSNSVMNKMPGAGILSSDSLVNSSPWCFVSAKSGINSSQNEPKAKPSNPFWNTAPFCGFPNPQEMSRYRITTMADDQFRSGNAAFPIEFGCDRQDLVSTTKAEPSASLEKKGCKRKRQVMSPKKTVSVKTGKSDAVYVRHTNMDVLLGRGGTTNVHVGNQRFLSARDVTRPRYQRMKRTDKALVAQELVDTVHAWGGRFLKKARAQQSDLWVEVDIASARRKASQALREKILEKITITQRKPQQENT